MNVVSVWKNGLICLYAYIFDALSLPVWHMGFCSSRLGSLSGMTDCSLPTAIFTLIYHAC